MTNFMDEEDSCCKCGKFGRIANLAEPYCITCYKHLVAPRSEGCMPDVDWNGRKSGSPRRGIFRIMPKELVEDDNR